MAPQSPCVYVCRSCTLQIRTNAYKIQCIVCKNWLHRDCANLSIEDIQHYIKNNNWCCNTCQITSKAKQTMDMKKSANTATDPITLDSLTKENQFLRRLIQELEEKNSLLKENKSLLEDKVTNLERRLVDKNTKVNKTINSTPANLKTPVAMQPVNHLNSTVPVTPRQVPLDMVSNGNEWQIVKPRRFTRRRTQVGTAATSNTETEENVFSGKPERIDKKAWLFISRVKDIVTEEHIKSFIKKKTKLEDNDVIVTRFPTKYDNIRKDGKCFKIGIKFDLKDKVYESDFWPSRVAFSRFKFDIQPKEGGDFLDDADNQDNRT